MGQCELPVRIEYFLKSPSLLCVANLVGMQPCARGSTGPVSSNCWTPSSPQAELSTSPSDSPSTKSTGGPAQTLALLIRSLPLPRVQRHGDDSPRESGGRGREQGRERAHHAEQSHGRGVPVFWLPRNFIRPRPPPPQVISIALEGAEVPQAKSGPGRIGHLFFLTFPQR